MLLAARWIVEVAHHDLARLDGVGEHALVDEGDLRARVMVQRELGPAGMVTRDRASVRGVVDTATCFEGAPLGGIVNLVGESPRQGKVADTPIYDCEQQFRLNVRPLYLVAAAGSTPNTGTTVCASTRSCRA